MDTSQPRILMIDDDQVFVLALTGYLKNNGFNVEFLTDGKTAVQKILDDMPDAVILDGILPSKDGFDICKEVQSLYPGSILMLTGRHESVDEILALELGADDYISKPAEPRVVLAHLRACLRRPSKSHFSQSLMAVHPSPNLTEYKFGTFYISNKARNAQLNGKTLDLTSAEFNLLWFLTAHAGKIVSRDELFSILRGAEYDGLDRSVDIIISRVRKRLNDDAHNPQKIKTVRSKGYLFNPEGWAYL